MTARILVALLALTVVVALGACSSPVAPEPDDGSSTPGDATSGLRLAPGLYDQQDGTVLAIGTLEHRDLEGGFYAIVDSTGATAEAGGVVAVVNNPDAFSGKLQSLLGKGVTVTGTRFEGASIRMAGPEIVVTSIEEITDTPGAAE